MRLVLALVAVVGVVALGCLQTLPIPPPGEHVGDAGRDDDAADPHDGCGVDGGRHGGEPEILHRDPPDGGVVLGGGASSPTGAAH